MAKKPIKVTEVVLRDAHQSLLATRMTMDEMRPILAVCRLRGSFSASKMRMTSMPFATDFCTKYSTASSA